jgi:hypothetical protein
MAPAQALFNQKQMFFEKALKENKGLSVDSMGAWGDCGTFVTFVPSW